MAEWRASTWGEEISLEYGKSLRDYDAESGRYRVFGSNGPIGWTDKPLASGPGIILGRKGAYRGVEYSRDPFFVIDTAYYVVPKSELDMRWLYYAIKHYKLGEIDDGSPIPSTTRAAVYVRELDVPPLAQQQAIASMLGVLDDKIDVNQRMNATLEAIAGALFKSWFVDFDPVHAKLDGHSHVALDPATIELFPASFDHSVDGLVPRGWRATTLGEVIEVSDSKRVPLSARERAARPGEYPYYGAASVMDYVDDFLFDGVFTLMGEDGSVLNEDGTPVLQYVWGKFWVNNHAHVLRGKNDISTEHVLLHLKGSNIAPFVNGAVQQKLNQGNMNRIPFMCPSPEIARAFAQSIDPLFARIRANAEQSRTLAQLRNTLMPKLLSGELTTSVPEAMK